MSKHEKTIRYELIDYQEHETDSDSSQELLSRRFDTDDGHGIVSHTYDPDAHCTAKHPTSYFETFINFFKALVGIGIFSLPAAFAQVGYIPGSIGLVTLTCLSVYCEKILVDVQYELAKRRHTPCLNFQETVEAAFKDGPHKFSGMSSSLKVTVKILIHIITFGGACVYNVVIAENMKVVFDTWWGVTNIRIYMLLLLIPLILINLIKNLKFIAPLSLISNVIIIITIISVLIYIFQIPSSLNHGHAFADWFRLPQFAGTVFFSISCITMILPMKNDMKHPGNFAKQPWGVLTAGSTVILILYWIFGMCGYLKYGDNIQESITLNLPREHLAPKVIQGGLALAIFLSTPINNYVLFDILIEDLLGKSYKGKRRVMWEYVIHILVVTASVVTACAIPNLSLLVSLLGVGANAVLAMTVPAVIHLMTISHLSFSTKCLDYLTILLSFVFMVTGTVENLNSIIKLYFN